MADRISYPNKELKDKFKATEATEIKSVVNSHADEIEITAQRISSTEAEIDSNIKSTLGLTYDLLDDSKASYTNIELANKQFYLISNQTTNYPLLQSDGLGVINLGFTATPGFVGVLLGSLGTAPNADVFIGFLKEVFTKITSSEFTIADRNGYIGLKFSQSGLETFRANFGQISLMNGARIIQSGADDVLFGLVDAANYYGLKFTSDGTLYVKKVVAENTNNKLEGKVIGIMQDSFGVAPRASGGITTENIWHKVFQNNTGCVYSAINAVGGTCLSQKVNVDYGLQDSRINALNGTLYQPEQVDIIILALFTNDFGGQNIQLGTYGTSDLTTWYGALPEAYKKLTTRYKNAKVFHIIGPVRNRLGLETAPNTSEKPGYSAYNANTGFYYDDFANAVYKVAPSFGVKIIDMRYKSILTLNNLGTPGNPNTLENYIRDKSEDGLHMLEEAHADYSNGVQTEIEQYF